MPIALACLGRAPHSFPCILPPVCQAALPCRKVKIPYVLQAPCCTRCCYPCRFANARLGLATTGATMQYSPTRTWPLPTLSGSAQGAPRSSLATGARSGPHRPSTRPVETAAGSMRICPSTAPDALSMAGAPPNPSTSSRAACLPPCMVSMRTCLPEPHRRAASPREHGVDVARAPCGHHASTGGLAVLVAMP